MKRRIVSFFIVFSMLLSCVGVSAYADEEYHSAGNKQYAQSQGTMDALDAILLNMGEYGLNVLIDAAGAADINIYTSVGDYATSKIEDELIKKVPALKRPIIVLHFLDSAKYAYSDLATAFRNAGKSKMELFNSATNAYEQCIESIDTLFSATYERGKNDRKSNADFPKEALDQVDRVVKKNYDRADGIRKSANNVIFTFSPGMRKSLHALADQLDQLTDSCISAREVYNLGRFGVTEWDYSQVGGESAIEPPTKTPEKTPQVPKQSESQSGKGSSFTESQISYNKDYRTWKASDPYWENVYLDSKNKYAVGDYSSAVTMAIVIVDSGLKSSNNFNPKVFVEQAKSSGTLNSGGEMVWGSINKTVKGFNLAKDINLREMSQSQKIDEIKTWRSQNYEVIVQMPSNYIGVDKVSGNTVYMWDPQSNKTDLFKTYGNQPTRLLIYDYSGREIPEKPKKEPVKSDELDFGKHTDYKQAMDENCLITSLAMVLNDMGISATEKSVYKANGNSSYVNWGKINQAFGVTDKDYVIVYDWGVTGKASVKDSDDYKKKAVDKIKKYLDTYPKQGVIVNFNKGGSAKGSLVSPHSMVAIGYKGDTIYFNDPAGGSCITLEKSSIGKTHGWGNLRTVQAMKKK